MSWIKRWRRRLRAVVRREDLERELSEELAFHLQMQTEANLRAGMSPPEARRQAALKFGGVEKAREEVRDARFFGWIDGLSLDAKLGVRMLVKYPGLTVIGGLGMAVAIAAAAIFDGSLGAANRPMPIAGGERIVALEVWDAEINNQESQFLYDYGVWAEQVRSIELLGAYRTAARSLLVPGGSNEPVDVAEMTASGFDMVRTPPLLGRPLVESDQVAGAPDVAVIGYDLWHSRFGGDPGVVGREVRLGGGVHTIVGVMPEGFGFPLAHQLWVPLRLDPGSFAPREGPGISAFGRLAPDVSISDAQAELTMVGTQTTAAFPETHRHLRPRVVQYGPHLLDDMQGWEIPAARGLITLLLVIIAVNVSVLVFARTATRAGEITVRSALGASRKRIVTQFFAEAAVLTLVSTALGLAVAAFALRRLQHVMDGALAPMGGLPFWFEFRLSTSAVLFAVGLSAMAAIIVGVLPALRATGSRLESTLRQLGGATGLRFGRTWSILIVAQVAITVAFLPGTLFYALQFGRYGMKDPGFAAEEYLTTFLVLDRPTAIDDTPMSDEERNAHYQRYTAVAAELKRRLESEPEVLAATYSAVIPAGEPAVRFQAEGVEQEGGVSRPGIGARAKYNRIDPHFFDAFELQILSGRGFASDEGGPASATAIVNRSFVNDVLQGSNAVGRRIRFEEGYRAGGVMRVPNGLERERWYTIVGVVEDLPPEALEPDDAVAAVYRPLENVAGQPLNLTIHTRGAPAAFAPRLQEMTIDLDPMLQPRNLTSLETEIRSMQSAMRMGALGLALLIGSVLLLSAGGIYSLMSFTVTQRRREIGIRSALGANPSRVLAGIFSRAAVQLGLGAGIGLVVAVAINAASQGELTGGEGQIVLPAVAVIMIGVGLAATLGPARRGLNVEPMEALREE